MKLPKLQKRTMPGVGIEPTDTSHNGDKSERRQQKRRQPMDLWSKRRQPMVETATTNGQNGDMNKSITQTCDTISLHLMTHYNCYRYSNVVSKKPTDPV